ncbi:MAG: hypothetical protein KIT39_14960, partial [Nitrospirales bacterium]|nr:hypothetical protein [Nitrospirales bacterium]
VPPDFKLKEYPATYLCIIGLLMNLPIWSTNSKYLWASEVIHRILHHTKLGADSCTRLERFSRRVLLEIR